MKNRGILKFSAAGSGKSDSDHAASTFAKYLALFLAGMHLHLDALAVQDMLPLRPTRSVAIEITVGTGMSVDLSPDGRSVVFTLLGDLYVVPITGGDAVQITRGLAWDKWPAWSPDGSMLAYISDGTGSDNVWTVRPDGSDARPLTREAGLELSQVEWNGDGSRIIVSRKKNIVSETPVPGGVYDLQGRQTRQIPYRHLLSIRPASDRSEYHAYHEREVGTKVVKGDPETGKFVDVAAVPGMTGVLSPDGSSLVYVSSQGELGYSGRLGPNHLRVLDLETDKDRVLAKEIAHDRGSWERFAFTPDSKSVVIGFGGKLHRIDIASGRDQVIPFTADATVELAPRVYAEHRIDDSLVVRNVSSADLGPDGTRLVLSTVGRLFLASTEGETEPLADQAMGRFQPVYSPDGKWVAYVTWDDADGGHVWRVAANGAAPQRLTDDSGWYRNPAWSPDGALIAVVKGNYGNAKTGREEQQGDLVLLPGSGGESRVLASDVPMENSVAFSADGEHVQFLATTRSERGNALAVHAVGVEDGSREVLAAVAPLTDAMERLVSEVLISPDMSYVAYVYGGDAYLSKLNAGVTDSPLLDEAGQPSGTRLTDAGGYGLRWEQAGRMLAWIHDNRFYQASVEDAFSGRAARASQVTEIAISLPRQAARGTTVLRGGRVITMNGAGVMDEGTVVIRDGRIAAVGADETLAIPDEADVYDVSGMTLIPGLIDMHAHVKPPEDILASQWPEFTANLARGITTLRDPGIGRETEPKEAELYPYYEKIDAGFMLGPRVFGAVAIVGSRQGRRIKSQADARAFVRRMKATGALFIKVHDGVTRRQRQWLAIGAREEGLNITGHVRTYAGKLDASVLLDGFTGWEHSVPGTGKLYDDVRSLFAVSGAWYTPTSLIWGGRKFWGASEWGDMTENGSSARFPSDREQYMEEMAARDRRNKEIRETYGVDPFMAKEGEAYASQRVRLYKSDIENTSRIYRSGGNVAVGSHGLTPHGRSMHWELWSLVELGGISAHDALEIATIASAEGLGIQADLGSIEKGKLADIVILEQNPLDDIRNTLAIRYVMKGGVMYEAEALEAQ